MKKVFIEDMSWIEFREAMTANDLVIIPVGSIEEHGHHNPLGTDYFIAKQAAYDIGNFVDAPVAPLLPIGNASNLMGFPGTVSIDNEAYIITDSFVDIFSNLVLTFFNESRIEDVL